MPFCCPQEHKQRSAGLAGGGDPVDLVSYVEFQHNFRMLLVYHKAALTATRDVWRLLLKEDISLQLLLRSFRKIDQVGAAGRGRGVL